MKNKINQTPKDRGEIMLAWSFPERKEYQRSSLWYVIILVVIGFLLFYSYKTNNIFFAAIIIMITIILATYHRGAARQMEAKLTEDGLILNDIFFDYRDFKDFAIVYRPPEVKNIYFEFKSFLRPRLTISLENQNPNEVRQILLERIAEDLTREDEPLSEFLARIFKI